MEFQIAMSEALEEAVSIANARDNFADILNRVAYGKQRVVLTRRGRSLAAVVPIENLELLEDLEDERDSAIIRERMMEWRATGKPAVDLDTYLQGQLREGGDAQE